VNYFKKLLEVNIRYIKIKIMYKEYIKETEIKIRCEAVLVFRCENYYFIVYRLVQKNCRPNVIDSLILSVFSLNHPV